MQTAKETAANVAASAKAGMEKTKATVEEKTEKMRSSDPLQKELATQKKEQRILEAEREKQEARQQNAAAKHVGSPAGPYGQGFTAGGDHYSTATAEQQPSATGYTGQGEVPVRHDRHPQGTTEGAGYPDAGTNSGGVGYEDPNVVGRTGYGSGNTE